MLIHGVYLKNPHPTLPGIPAEGNENRAADSVTHPAADVVRSLII